MDTTRPWEVFYEDMPGNLTYPDVTLYEALEESALTGPRRNIYDFLGHRRTYRFLLSEVKRLARGFWSVGIRPGDRVGTVLPNCPQVFIATYALNRIGAVVCVLDDGQRSRDLQDTLDDLCPKWAIVSDEVISGFQRCAIGADLRGLIVSSLSDYAAPGRVRKMKRMHRRHGKERDGLRGASSIDVPHQTSVSEPPPVFAWQSVRKLGSSVSQIPEHRTLHAPTDAAVILYTGGTTGKSAGVMFSDRNMDAFARQMQVQGPILPGQKVFNAVPFSHGLGYGVSVHCAVVSGAESIVAPFTRPRSIARLIRSRRPEYLVGVPSFYASLLSERAFQRARLGFLMGAFVGGERITLHLLDAFEMAVRRGGGAVGLREGYGLTECVAACTATPDRTRRLGSVGIPVPDTIVRIAVISDHRDSVTNLPPGAVGEILVSGPSVMMGYVNRQGKAELLDADGRTWLRTGDFGRMDPDGFVYFVDRSEMCVATSSGLFLPGTTIDTLNAHPEVKESCVSITMTDSGPTVTAHVVPIDGGLEPDWVEETLRNWCLQNLDECYRPRTYIFTRALPHTRVGVVDCRQLAQHSPNA